MPEIHVRTSGPIFSALPAQKAEAVLAKTISELVAEGEKRVKLQLYTGHGVRTGFYRRSVHGEVLGSRHGIIHDSRVIYGPWLEGVTPRNRTTRFKGYAMFRNAYQQLDRMAQGVLNKHAGRAAKDLS